MIDSKVHAQSNSKLLSAPLEVRREIYSHLNFVQQTHLFLQDGKFCMALCLQPSLGDNFHDGRERRDDGCRDYRNQEWARRLASTWGQHWECEEHAYMMNKRTGTQHVFALRFVCKKMFLDVCDLISGISEVTVTDLNTLDVLVAGQHMLGNSRNCEWNVLEHLQCRITRLNLALRLPLAFYRALEENDSVDIINATSSTIIASMRGTWMRVWQSICRLRHLRTMVVWLDHDDPSSWSVIKEKLILDDIFESLEEQNQARSLMKDPSQRKVLFNLPKLHPGIAKLETHFVEETTAPPFPIERRYRQRYHCCTRDDNSLEVKLIPDFPITHEVADIYANEELGDQSMTYEESEEIEKSMWLRGEDVEQEIREIMAIMGGIACY